MYKILFVCHGNICRSPLAEILFKKIISENNDNNHFIVESKATSLEEIGNPIYPEIKKLLIKKGIKFSEHYAERIKISDLDYYDYIIAMDNNNIKNMERFFNVKSNKIYKLLSFINEQRDVYDPWYTRDFEKAFSDIDKGVKALYNHIKNQQNNC